MLRNLPQCFFVVPPVASSAIEILEVANGLRPLSDLDPVVWFDTSSIEVVPHNQLRDWRLI